MKNLAVIAFLFLSSQVFATEKNNPTHPQYNGVKPDVNVNINANENYNKSNSSANANGGSGGSGGAGGAGGKVSNVVNSSGGSSVSSSAGGTGGNSVAHGGTGGSSVSNSQGGTSASNSQANTDNANNSAQSVNLNQNYEAKRIPVSSAYSPALTSGTDTCLGSFSAGGQGALFGFSFGKTTTDDNCVMLKQARMMHEMGMRVAAWQRMCQDKNARAAIVNSGEYDCKSTAAQLVAFEDQKISEKNAEIARLEAEANKVARLAEADRIIRANEISMAVAEAKRAYVHTVEIGTPTYVEPQSCKPVAKKSKQSARLVCK